MTKPILLALLACSCSAQTEKPSPGPGPFGTPPTTRKNPVTNTYHGVAITEDYRWLEDWKDEAVQKWTEAQNVYAREHLDTLPGRARLRERIDAVLKGDTHAFYGIQYANGRLFAEKYQPPKQQLILVFTEAPFDSNAIRVVLDPNLLDETGSTTIDWYEPSWDGKLVAVSLSKGGTESGDVHIYDVETGQRVHEIVPRVNGGTAGGHLAWAKDNKGFYFTRYPRGNERPEEDRAFYQQLYFHALGENTSTDRYEIGKGFPRIAEIEVVVDPGTGRVIATVQKGDGGEFAHYLRDRDGTWTQFSEFGDRIVQATFGPEDDIYLISRADAPRGKLLRTRATKPNPKSAEVIVPEGQDALINSFWGSSSLVIGRSRIYAQYQLGGPAVIKAFDLTGKPVTPPEQLPVSAVDSLTHLGGDDLAFINRSYLEPAAVYWYSNGQTRRTALHTVSPARYDGIEVVREMAISEDGTRVPVNIIKPRDMKLDGSAPLVLNAYGGYGVSRAPRFSASVSVLLERGVLYAVANIRGGGEFGEDWHRQGMLTQKQNCFDDFAAVARHLIARGYTAKDRVGFRGGSNGGLLMGAMITQHPDLAAAVVSHVGIYDMLRVELSPNGAFNVTEYGTVEDPEQFRALYAYSPYHNVKDATSYPPVLMLTGANDPRVDPMQSRKMIARLQAANTGGTPVILRSSLGTGHVGTPLDEMIDELVDEFAFFLFHLGVTRP